MEFLKWVVASVIGVLGGVLGISEPAEPPAFTSVTDEYANIRSVADLQREDSAPHVASPAQPAAPVPSQKIVTSTYAIEIDVEVVCSGISLQRLVHATKSQDGTWATTTLAADVVTALESAQIEAQDSVWRVFSVPHSGQQIILSGSRCHTDGGEYPLVTFDLQDRTFKRLAVSDLHHAHSAWEFSSDRSKIVEARRGANGDTLVLIDLLRDTSTLLVTLPKGKHFASICELGRCASPLRWIDEDTIEYGIFGEPTFEYREIPGVPGTHRTMVPPKNPEEIRRVDLP